MLKSVQKYLFSVFAHNSPSSSGTKWCDSQQVSTAYWILITTLSMISYLCNIQPSKEIEKDVFPVFLQAWDKEKNLSTHEEPTSDFQIL